MGLKDREPSTVGPSSFISCITPKGGLVRSANIRSMADCQPMVEL